MAEGKAGAEGIVDPGGMPPGIAAAPVLIGGGMLICPAAPGLPAKPGGPLVRPWRCCIWLASRLLCSNGLRRCRLGLLAKLGCA